MVSVDTKKKELIGDFKNGGREWRRRGKPLISHEVIVQLIANTTTAAGLKIRAALDPHRYSTGKKVSHAELERVHWTPAPFHGDWNYVITPR